MLRTLLVVLVLATHAVIASAAPPNIVLILSDDQAWTDYGFMEHPVIQTPHLDRLAARSAVFRRGYTPSPLCRPSLMSILTGRYAHRHGVTGNDPRRPKNMSQETYNEQCARLNSKIDEQPALPRLLVDNGWRALQTGKWWEGNWKTGGFTHGMTRGFPEKGGRHGDDGLKIGRETMQPIFDFIAESTATQQPFFVWYAPMLPHTPHDPPERLLEKYRAADRPEALAKYFAMCEWFDESCGALLNHLDEKELTRDTIVMYVTDNGWIQATPEMKLGPDWKPGFAPRSKMTPYEGGIRTPIIISWPGVIEPAEHSELASTLDVLPTLLDAANLSQPLALDGMSLMPLIRDHRPLNRHTLCGESYSHDVADISNPEASLLYRWTIVDDWKLIVSYDNSADRYSWVHAVNDRRPQLYNLSDDPHEQQNLAGEHPDKVRELMATLQSGWDVTLPVMAGE